MNLMLGDHILAEIPDSEGQTIVKSLRALSDEPGHLVGILSSAERPRDAINPLVGSRFAEGVQMQRVTVSLDLSFDAKSGSRLIEAK